MQVSYNFKLKKHKRMRKFILIGAVLTIAVVIFTSCVKTCKCKEVEDDVVKSNFDQPVEIGVKCEDLSSYTTDPATGKKTGDICE